MLGSISSSYLPVNFYQTPWHLPDFLEVTTAHATRGAAVTMTCIGWPLLFAIFLLTGAETCGEEILSGFLQVSVNVEQPNATVAVPGQLSHPHGPKWIWLMKAIDQGNHAGQVTYQHYQPEKVTHLLYFLGQLSRGVVILLYFCLLMMVLAWLLYGLPKKAQQDERVKDGCSKTWWIFLCSTYGFVYFSTDQYAPSLPQMGVDLSGSQWLMSATVQFNCITKALMGLVIAGISDHVGRRPVMVGCLSLLAMASFCCGCAPNADWFLASRFLQGLGESVEPVVFATCRDYFAKPEDRMMVITVVQLVGSVAQMVAPIFGGFSSIVFGWRFSFFCLALLWGSHAAYAARYMLESCPDSSEEKEEGSYFFGLRKIFTPGPLCLLFTECCAVVPFMVFTSNIGYVTQVNYGQSPITTSFCMLSWAVIDAIGVIGTQCLQSTSGLSIPQMSRIMMAPRKKHESDVRFSHGGIRPQYFLRAGPIFF